MGEWCTVTVPNVLATRYAAADLAEIWSPEHKIVLERQLWIAVLKAQRDLGIDVPDGVQTFSALVGQDTGADAASESEDGGQPAERGRGRVRPPRGGDSR